jgi:WD40 repeat protein
MPKFMLLMLWSILFTSQIKPPPTPDLSAEENQVKRLLVIYTDVDGYNMDWNADGSLILTGVRDTLRLWDAETLEEIYSLKNGERLEGIEFNADGKRFLTWSASSIRIWDTATGSLLGTLSIDSFPGFRGVM